MNADLHCHSYYSDGILAPAEVMERAHANGVNMITLTDHDEIAGVPEARERAEALGMQFLAGAELSVSWGDDVTIHIVGLGLDVENSPLVNGLKRVRDGRDSRAHRISDELAKVGIPDAYEGALKHAHNPALISRSHFARYIVELGMVKDVKSVFPKWLGKGNPGYIPHQWASLEEAIGWIRAAGGMAIVAHPGRYWLSPAQMVEFLDRFKELGGQGIEVISGSHKPDHVEIYADYARRYGFFASRASDFHAPGESWTDLGKLPDLPTDLKPVWTEFV